MLIGSFFIVPVFYTPFVFSQEGKGVVIINNEASSTTQTQAITAPALVPSDAVKLRDVREKQEIKTEDTLMKELEKQRLLDEQKRVDKLLGNTAQESPVSLPSESILDTSKSEWFFGNKSFVSFGAGVVSYPGVGNINSTDSPAYFFSFGGYGYTGNLIFNLSLYYSKHYTEEYNKRYQKHEYKATRQPAIAMAVKASPLNGKMKPYAGVSGSVVFRQVIAIHRSGEAIEDYAGLKELTKNIAEKKWKQAFDAGLAIGADLALGDHLGLNLDVRYHVNLYPQNPKTSDEEPLDSRDSVIVSGNLRYYF